MRGWFLAIEDEYRHHYPTKIFLQFREVATHRCGEETLYREPIHVDVFRLLPGETYVNLSWLKDEKKEKATGLAGLYAADAPAGMAPASPNV